MTEYAHCRLSARMTRSRCNAIQATSPSCIGCQGVNHREVMITLSFPAYAGIMKFGATTNQTVEEVIAETMTYLAGKMEGNNEP